MRGGGGALDGPQLQVQAHPQLLQHAALAAVQQRCSAKGVLHCGLERGGAAVRSIRRADASSLKRNLGGCAGGGAHVTPNRVLLGR